MYPFGRPRDWYEMTPEQQREWKKQQSALEDAEHDKEQAERRAANALREGREARQRLVGELTDLQDQLVDLEAATTDLRTELNQSNRERVLLEQFIAAQNLQAAYAAWKETASKPAISPDPQDTETCALCGNPFFITTDGIAHHYDGDAPDSINHDSDGAHVPYTQNR